MKQNVYQSTTRSFVKREHMDRRYQNFKSFLYSMNKGNRVKARRQIEKARGYYTDSYEKRVGLCVIAITLLSALDALFTLNILAKGGVEVNPFMSALLEYNTYAFMIGKMVITMIGLIIVLIHINFHLFKIISVKLMLLCILTGYVLLVGYELILLAII